MRYGRLRDRVGTEASDRQRKSSDDVTTTGLEKSQQLQVGGVFDDHWRRDMRDVVVWADFCFLHRSTESVGRRVGPVARLGRPQFLGDLQQVLQHLQDRVAALSLWQGTQAGFEALQPLSKVVDALDTVAGLDQPVDILIESD